jgi:hypothetical protein
MQNQQVQATLDSAPDLRRSAKEMKITEYLREHTAQAIVVGLSAAIGTSLTVLVRGVWRPLVEHVFPRIDTSELLWLVLLLCLTIATLVVILLSQREPKMKARFGVYWDKQKNPRCPACESPLVMQRPFAFICQQCKKEAWIELRKESGERINLEDAQKLI